MSHAHDTPSTRDLASPSVGSPREDEPAADVERADVERTDAERADIERSDTGTTDGEHHGAEPSTDAVGPTTRTDHDDEAARGVGIRSGTIDDEPAATGASDEHGHGADTAIRRDEPEHDENARASESEGAVVAASDRDDRNTPVGEGAAHERSATGAGENGEDGGALLPADVDKDFQGRWDGIQARFVDDPRSAVEDADTLVASLMQQLADGFARERDRLEGQWSRGEDVSTEDLRVVLQRYRSFFRRLLSA